jgi:hypothetical protein
MADQKLETMTGRVYRVAPKGHKPTAHKLDLSTARGAVEALKSPNLTARHAAWTALHGMGAKAEPELKKLWSDANPRFRARALHLLTRIPGRTQSWVDAALVDKDSDLRITALRIARAEGLDIIATVKRLVNDPEPQVRRECAIALRHHKSAEVPTLWAQLAAQHDGKDRWYTEALGIGADRNWDACLDAYLSAKGGVWNTTSGREIIWRSRAKKTPSLLVLALKDPSTTEKEKARFLRAFDFQTGPEKDSALLELLTSSK